jgi:DNA-binding transcriptional MerR regulator
MKLDFFSTLHVCKLFDVSHQTVKNWCDEFVDYLSPYARPGGGQKRLFTVDDMRVFALIAEYRQRGWHWKDAHKALAKGERGTIPEQAAELTPTASPEVMLAMRDEIENLRVLLRDAEAKKEQESGKVMLLKEQLEQKEGLVRSLYQEIADLRSDRREEK